ncbi:MAG: hypothetical protein LDL41_04775 [Coleofasciculus sp. S288]|nr:hypothetical protein [Coleofasciculus sp. S288]
MSSNCFLSPVDSKITPSTDAVVSVPELTAARRRCGNSLQETRERSLYNLCLNLSLASKFPKRIILLLSILVLMY